MKESYDIFVDGEVVSESHLVVTANRLQPPPAAGKTSFEPHWLLMHSTTTTTRRVYAATQRVQAQREQGSHCQRYSWGSCEAASRRCCCSIDGEFSHGVLLCAAAAKISSLPPGTVTLQTDNKMATDKSAPDATVGSNQNAGVTTYHCLCTHLVLATNMSLENMPKRHVDAAAISTVGIPTGSSSATLTMQGLSADDKATVLKLEDGFEKRYPVRCSRCGLMAGYHLDKSQFSETKEKLGPNVDILYILPGGLTTTLEMRDGRNMEKEVGLVAGD